MISTFHLQFRKHLFILSNLSILPLKGKCSTAAAVSEAVWLNVAYQCQMGQWSLHQAPFCMCTFYPIVLSLMWWLQVIPKFWQPWAFSSPLDQCLAGSCLPIFCSQFPHQMGSHTLPFLCSHNTLSYTAGELDRGHSGLDISIPPEARASLSAWRHTEIGNSSFKNENYYYYYCQEPFIRDYQGFGFWNPGPAGKHSDTEIQRVR